MRKFDLLDPLPQGVTVLEASAGTGKTYTISALAVRFLAEGLVDVSGLLLVTFSRAATAELRSRVRERVRSSADALAAAVNGVPPTDALDSWLAQVPADELAVRSARLRSAATNFDQATIMTTHQFSHAMISGLGILAAQEPQSQLVENLTPLAEEVAADQYLKRYAYSEQRPPLPFFDVTWGRNRPLGALSLAVEAVNKPGRLVPESTEGEASQRVAFATAVRQEVERRKTTGRLFSFQDQLSRLDSALNDPETGALARAKLARRFPVVLVDEFQDTDPVQWSILRSAFGSESGATLVLIGDPKQAIYKFRGADIHAYSAAVMEAESTTTLTTNHRSDKPLVEAVVRLFDGVKLGDLIEVPPVDAAHDGSRLVSRGRPWSSGIQIRCLDDGEQKSRWPGQQIATDLVAVVAGLLGPDAPLGYPHRPLHPDDIAILVRSNWQGRSLATRLRSAGIPASFAGADSVFNSEAADEWHTLMTALDQPRRPHLQRAIITRFLGGTVAGLATASDDDWARWTLQIRTWARTLASNGVPALLAAIERDVDFTPRLLAQPHGERLATDFAHVAELLHKYLKDRGNQPRDAAAWLKQAIAQASPEEGTRRLETDSGAVQIMTIHRAKGRQFPVVLLPDAARSPERLQDSGRTLELPAVGDRLLDVGGLNHPGRSANWDLASREESDESLRVLYVALTRAQSHAIAWWANTKETERSALHRLLNMRRTGASVRPARSYPARSPLDYDWPEDHPISVLRVDRSRTSRLEPDPVEWGELRVRDWHRTIDQTWRRTSYSGLTAGLHDETPGADEPPIEIETTPDPGLAQISPMAAFPGGTTFGNLVHAVMEQVDPRGPDWKDRLGAVCATALSRWPIPDVEAPELAAALVPALETPLGPLSEGTTLRDFGPGNRLTELDFELPLNSNITLGDLAEVLRPNVVDTPLEAYPDALAVPALASQSLRGFLTGSIDAVFRLPGGSYLVADYKTNRLSEPGIPPEELSIGRYTPDALAEAMIASHYPLQALLYSVALHRFLSWRQPDYDPEAHLGGIAYLFVRGMTGPDTPLVDGSPLGVFSWRPAPEMVSEISSLLAGGAS